MIMDSKPRAKLFMKRYSGMGNDPKNSALNKYNQAHD